jgi:hypothetical protein
MANSDIKASQWFADRKVEQEAAHAGDNLLAAARECCKTLPEGPITLLATSAEGIALAGAIVALREAPTSWRQVTLRRGAAIDGTVAVVEMVQLAEGLRAALLRRYPGALVLDGPASSATSRDSGLATAA